MEIAQNKVPTLDLNNPQAPWGRLELLCQTSSAWTDHIVNNLNAFLIDHAACERKASSLAMSFVVKYRDKPKIVRAMTELAIEELEHFNQVLSYLEKNNLCLGGDEPDQYVGELLKICRSSPQERLLDRLLVSGVVEARGCERFGLIGEALGDTELGHFYSKLSRAESKHQLLFVQLACEYFEKSTVSKRLFEILQFESQIVAKLPIKAQLY